MEKLTLSITEIGKPSLLRGFSSGNSSLDEYLKRFAKGNHTKGIGKTFVAISGGKLIGYYTISMGEVAFQVLPNSFKLNLPRYPLPVARIGKLAIDKVFQGQGWGKLLLVDALHRIQDAASAIAAYAVFVDAKDDKAKAFYEHFGFIPLSDNSLSLLLPLQSLEDVE